MLLQDTLKAKPTEAAQMKKATSAAVFVTTTFYLGIAVVGYAAFGDSAPGNLLTGFGFFNPYWLVGLANVMIMVHLVGAYQVPIHHFAHLHLQRCISHCRHPCVHASWTALMQPSVAGRLE